MRPREGGTRAIAFCFSAMCACLHAVPAPADRLASASEARGEQQRIEHGRRMYMDGVLPSGAIITATVAGDVRLTGEQVVCGACHRRSGMGSSEGQEVVPAVTGDILLNPLRIPTSKPPLAPELRPAYTEESLKLAIRDGVGADGKALSPLMPRYPLSDGEIDSLIAYLETLSTQPAPGVTDTELHFATVVADAVHPAAVKALTDVLVTFFEQKNTETRHESQRAEHAPWHKEWIFGPYRKWVLHVWELKGPRQSWPEQLEAQYRKQPVFALLSGIVPGSWLPVHDFCETSRMPCLFPITDLPVIDERDFYTVYLSRGMVLEAQTIARHLADDGLLGNRVVQVYRDGDARGETAAVALRASVRSRGGEVKDIALAADGGTAAGFWPSLLDASRGGSLVLWLDHADLQTLWVLPDTRFGPERIYLSTTIFDGEINEHVSAAGGRIYFARPYEMPDRLQRLLLRSTGWLRAKHIYSRDEERVQADAYFALKMAGGALQGIQGFFIREYFLEQIEHMVDNASYTSVYPRVSLAPGQRFVAKGCYVARVSSDGKGRLVTVTDWSVP